ncbi:MAG: type Z 30S ribosomal protein S14 [Planctomycetota bacterium]
MSWRLCLRVKAKRKPRIPGAPAQHCSLCGRSRAYYRKFGICRICFIPGPQGEIPGAAKASW